VSETEINDSLIGELGRSGDVDVKLAGLQQKLKCGTHCGSCVPELKKIISSPQMSAKAA
jgi:assimilatory nitrate reductase catalytic subunit